MGYVFLIPGFVFLGCFLVFPFFKSLVRSFTDWNAFGSDLSFVGLKNYIELFHNDEYWAAIKVNLVFAVVSTLIQTTLGFLLAFAVYYMTPKWQQFYKVALYIPVVLPASVEEHCPRHGYCGKYLAVYRFYDGFILYCDDEYFQRCSGIRSG